MTRPAAWAVVALLSAPACHGWSSSRPLMPECNWPAASPRVTAPALAELGAVRPYRNYLAVSRVDPIGEHFVLWTPLEMNEVRVARDASGRVVVELEGGMEGGVGSGPATLPAMPADVAALAHDLESELRGHCPDVSSWKIEYKGRYRRVTVQEFIALDATPRAGNQRSGWFANYQVEMDESLRGVLGTAGYMHGAGLIEVAHDAQWLPIAPGNATKLALVSDGPASLASEISDAAQRLARGASGLSLASLVPADAPLLPPGFSSRIVARVALRARLPTRPPPGAKLDAKLEAPIEIRDAVFGTGATGDAETVLAGRRYRLHATLTPEAPLTPSPRLTRGEFRGSLALRIEDEDGQSWQRAYPAHGALDLENDTVAAPWGLAIPGASSPSPEAEALRGQLPGFGPYRAVELRVDIQTHLDPRPGR